MATVQHSALTDPNIHEPKGITTAQEGQVYVADGANSGDWMFPVGHAYGEIYLTGGTATQTLPTSSGKAKLNPTGGWQENGHNNVTLDGTNGEITVLQAGEYSLNFWISFTTASLAAGTKYYFHYAVNDTESTRKVVLQKHTSGADIVTVSSSGLVSLEVNDVISIYVGGDSTSSNTLITPLEAGLTCLLIQPA